jgi:hypothetical protein
MSTKKQLEEISAALANASKLHKGQSDELKGMAGKMKDDAKVAQDKEKKTKSQRLYEKADDLFDKDQKVLKPKATEKQKEGKSMKRIMKKRSKVQEKEQKTFIKASEAEAKEKASLNQDAMQAMVAGGSRPMHQGTSSQIDPMTGMPIVTGGQMNINPAFSGSMQNSGVPNYNPSMNMANITQARIELSREEKKNQIMSRDLPNEVKQNMIEGINQEADKVKVDGTLVARMGEAAAKAAPILKNIKIVENIIVPDTTYKIGNKGPRKSMRVKRNK